MQVGLFHVPERCDFPETRTDLRRHMRAFGRSIGLDVRFASHEKSRASHCDLLNSRALVIDVYKGKTFPLLETAHTTLHECAHWMDWHNGLFQDYYVRRGRKHVIVPKDEDIKRLGIRAEQHCDWLANHMLWAMYGKWYKDCFYDDVGAARLALMYHYDIEY